MSIQSEIEWLNNRTREYNNGHPTVSDKQWDDRYFDLKASVGNLNDLLQGNPLTEVDPTFRTSVSKLEKVEHNHPMLSLDKTKNIFEILSFLNNQDYIAMAKMDGLTCSLLYENGRLIRAETRGDGAVGENISHNARVIQNIPKTINYKERLIVDGEVISSYINFEHFIGMYKNPRNFAAGSIRLLDSNECAKRGLQFIAWDMVEGFDDLALFSDKLDKLKELGFEVVPYDSDVNIQNTIENIKNEANLRSYPIDGIVFKFNDIKYGESLGKTSHHFKNALAYKFYDELASTFLRSIEWSGGRTGYLTPVAVFDPVDLEGSTISRASMHNINTMEELLGQPFEGQELQIFKANMIIPQISEAIRIDESDDINKYQLIQIPKVCPICGEPVEIKVNGDIKELYCPNVNCSGKIINQFNHFVSKKGLDIKGLSKATLEKLLEWGWIENLHDILLLKQYKKEWGKKPGFGAKSVENILNEIDKVIKGVTLEQFLSSLGIPLIGNTVVKDICTKIDSYEDFRNKCLTHFDFTRWEGFGDSKASILWNYDFTEADKVYNLIHIIPVEKIDVNLTLNGKTIVITGRLNEFKNRNELQKAIEDRGGKVVNTISKRTDYLINNDINSDSNKNKAAKANGIPIILEADFKAKFID